MKLRAFLTLSVATLALAACGEEAADVDAPTGEPVEAVAAPDGQQWSEIITPTDDGGFVMGNPDAPIQLVEYMSLTCPHCADFGETAYHEIRDDYVNSGRVSFEIRNFVRDPIDLTAAMLTRCGPEGSYFALTEASLSDQEQILTKAQEAQGSGFFAQLEQTAPEERPARIADALGLTDMFKARGISEDQQKACLSDSANIEALTVGTSEAGTKYAISGTPTFLINGSVVEGTTWPMIENRLQAAGAR